jgi:hypothetical protein
MYINTVAGSVMLYLQHDFYNIIFKSNINYTYSFWVAPPPPEGNILVTQLTNYVVCVRQNTIGFHVSFQAH